MKRLAIMGLAVIFGASACGKSQEQKQQEQAAQATAQAATQAARGLEAMAKGLEAMGSAAAGDQKPVDPVSFKDMQAFFPDLAGWQKEEPTGERMTSPFPFSTAEVGYTKDDSRIHVKFTDSAFNQVLLTPYAMFLTAGYEKETSDGYEKSTKVNGQPGWEKWNSDSRDGELNALVGKRFLVEIEGTQIADTKVLHEVANGIDMNRLAVLK